MAELLTIYSVWADMEDDEPIAYCLAEQDAKTLFVGYEECGDIIPVDVSFDLWLLMFKQHQFLPK